MKDNENSASLYNGVVDGAVKSILFRDVPAGKNYTMTIKRRKQVAIREMICRQKE